MNRVLFKQLLQTGAVSFCQIDRCRLGGVNEILAVYLMAAKFGVPVCPHAGGVGLYEYVQHLQMWDFVSVTVTAENRLSNTWATGTSTSWIPVSSATAAIFLRACPGTASR